MAPPTEDWLGASRRAADAVRDLLAARPTIAERAERTGDTGEGGDQTLEIDRAAEAAVFRELDGLHAAGHRFTAVSEERGTVHYGDPDTRVVIDPIDGSLNAKRGLPHHALSIAVAEGPAMADTTFGFVADLGVGEEWWAARGRGAFLDGRALDPGVEERRWADGRLELVGLESADPRWVAEVADELVELAHRVRALGAIALSLCQVAAARLDAMASLKACRAVDAAAGQLIAREAGARVAFAGADAPLAAPLDLEPHFPVVAARGPASCRRLADLVG